MSDTYPRATDPLRRHLLRLVPALLIIAGGTLVLASSATQADEILGVTKESDGAVVVTLTPKKLSEGELTVEITVNTHSVDDLDRYDLTEITTLHAGEEEVAPISAPRLEGHHAGGELVFPLEALPPALAIEILGLDQPAVRTFRWP